MSDWEEIIKDVRPLKNKGGSFLSSKVKVSNPKATRGKKIPEFVPAKVYPKLDLHQKTLEQASELCEEFFINNKGKEVIVITGKSGILKQTLPRWFELGIFAKYCKSVVEESTGGSYRIKL
jgi:hypothetical protein